VRDRTPELAAARGQPGAWHRADEGEYARRLRDKLLEEARETAAARTPDALLEELGDLLQLAYALAAHAGLEPAAIECARVRKARTHGSFARRLVWHDPAT
jgi:predicted house-cleaning noncanonical NTP pyrophosphatase (MazG superfamily)